MLRYRLIALLTIILAAPVSLKAAYQDKVIQKNFKVSPSAKIEIDNKFGKVHINTWDKNEVDVKVEIDVEGSRNLEEVLNSIHIEFDFENGGNYLGMQTQFDDIRTKASYSVNYIVNIPKKNSLSVSNKFGDVYLSDINGPVKLVLGYGQLKAERIAGSLELEMEFGSGMSQIAYVNKGNLDIKYTKITIDKAGPLKIDAQFSEVFSDDLSSANVEMKYGKLISGKVGTIDGNFSFSDFETALLAGNIDLDCKHNHVQIGKVDASVNELFFDGKFSKMDVGLTSENNFKFDFRLKFGDLKQKGIQLMFDYAEIDKTEKSYRGVIGNRNTSGMFRVIAEYGDLVLNYN